MSEPTDGQAFLLRGLVALANRGQGVLHVFENGRGKTITVPDPSPEFEDALAAAKAGEPDALIPILLHGLMPVEAEMLASELHQRSKGGQRVFASVERLYAERLRQIKEQLRADGMNGKVHIKAEKLLRAEDKFCREWQQRTGIPLPEIDWGALRNLIRR
jgi:hypothetical protein